jgi:hypothetical protein
MLASLIRHLRHNLIAYTALLVALSGSSYAAAALISGSQITPHSIPSNRLTHKAIAQLKGNRGPRGLRGAAGRQGPAGPAGPTGPQGIVGVGRVELTYGQVDPAALSEVKAFVATGSSSPNCLATLSESNFAVSGTTLYCGVRAHDGTNGVWVHVLLPDFAPSDLTMWVTVYQQDAQQYAAPVFCLCP